MNCPDTFFDFDALSLSESQRNAVKHYLADLLAILLHNAREHHGPAAGVALIVALADMFCLNMHLALKVNAITPAQIAILREAFANVMPRAQ